MSNWPLLDWRQIDTVLLDMDGTLLDLHFDTYFWLEHLPQRYAAIHQRPLESTRAWLHERLMQERGTLNWYCLDYWSDVLAVDIVALKREVTERIAFRPGVIDFLRLLRKHGKRSVIVTNAHRDSFGIKQEMTNIAAEVDQVISSHDYGEPKEVQAFWQRLQREMPFDPARTLLIDDSLSVLASAQRYGIAYLLAVSHPDSTRPVQSVEPFAPLDSFDQIHPEES